MDAILPDVSLAIGWSPSMGNDAIRRLTSCVVAAALAATTGLLAPSAARAQDTCDVVLQLDEPGPLDFFTLAVDYSAASGDFVGDSTLPNSGPSWGTEQLACTALTSVDAFYAIDDNAGLLSVYLAASTDPFAGPLQTVSCVLALDSGFPCPAPGDFAIVQENFPDDPIPPPFPFPPPPAASIVNVTARVPVCGDGFIEGTEECDDGNAADSDCCSSTCSLDPIGAPCPDADVCTLDQTCDGAGTCVAGETVSCDDGLFCTYDRCDPTSGCISDPIPGPYGTCGFRGRQARIDIFDSTTDDSRDRVRLSVSLLRDVIGDPSASTDYAICIFDAIGGDPVLVDQIEIPAGPPWVAKPGPRPRFVYVDRAGSTDGIQRILLKTVLGGEWTKFRLKAQGLNLTLPGPFGGEQYLANDPEVIVQIENSEGGCWRLDPLHGAFVKQGPDRFRGKTP